MLNTPVAYRNDEQKKYIVLLMTALKCFTNYPPVYQKKSLFTQLDNDFCFVEIKKSFISSCFVSIF